LDAIVINLDADVARYGAVVAQFAGYEGFTVVRSRGVYGATLPSLACGVLTRARNYKEQIGGGTLGVFLAHVAVWERIVESDADASLILEDDVRVDNLALLAAAAIPSDADIVFCNDIMQPFPQPPRDPVTMLFVDLDAGLRRLAHTGSRAVGMSGYILRKAGARKLLTLIERDLFFGHVDWQVLRYCLSETQVSRAVPDTDVARILRNRGPLRSEMRGYTIAPSVVFGLGLPSRRAVEDRLTAR
jgi:GR25 family glycosyltransferase involved in LPS biosynthesis